MKKIFIEAKYKGSIDASKIKADKLPAKLGLATSVQFVDFLDEIKEYLEDHGKKVLIEKGLQKYKGQILGCEQSAAVKLRAMVDAFLYIGDGAFHPIGIALKTGKEVFTFNPSNNDFSKVEKKEIEKIKMQRKAQLLKFHSSKEIGVIVSTKPGQNRLEQARKLKDMFPDKNFYLILFDNVDYTQLENFNFIECWLNTACPRIEEDIKALNLDEIN
jgi:2-(3-amino-3-carboxypropyl)histidine synthase